MTASRSMTKARRFRLVMIVVAAAMPQALATPSNAQASSQATVPTQPAAPGSVRPDDSNGPLVAGLAAAVVAIVAAGFFFSQRSRRNQP
ncbi:hypothetical protein [Paenarthrobacter sp. NPDC018779]|uniref:hypothetical protein n=1 Tax=Paenarthrobacter sp. NPDC018779 TaxID=3364375 RepID=UPI0037CB2C65